MTRQSRRLLVRKEVFLSSRPPPKEKRSPDVTTESVCTFFLPIIFKRDEQPQVQKILVRTHTEKLGRHSSPMSRLQLYVHITYEYEHSRSRKKQDKLRGCVSVYTLQREVCNCVERASLPCMDPTHARDCSLLQRELQRRLRYSYAAYFFQDQKKESTSKGRSRNTSTPSSSSSLLLLRVNSPC